MESLLAGGNKKDRVDQYKLINISWLKKMRFYGFGGVEFLFKTFKHTHPKSLALLLEATQLTLNTGQKITSIQSIYHLFNAIILIFYSVLCYWFMLLVFMKAAY